MNELDRFARLQAKRPHPHGGFYQRPHISRRQFFRHLASGIGGYYLADSIGGGSTLRAQSVETKNTAKNVIFLFMRGAPRHVDTFDLKELLRASGEAARDEERLRHSSL